MEVQSHNTNTSHLKDLFSNRFHSLPTDLSKISHVQNDFSSSDSNERIKTKEIKDEFIPSKEYKHISELKSQVSDGFKDVDSFIAMAQNLKKENILDDNDMVALNYLSKQSSMISFDEFNKIMRNDELDMKMKGLINQLVQKLQMIDYINNGAMSA